MKLDQFMDALLAEAQKAGMEAAEVFAVESSSFSCRAMNDELQNYSVSSNGGVGLRGVVNGRMGYAGTQAFDEAAIGQMINGVLESAELNEEEEQDEIFAGDKSYPELQHVESDLDEVSA